MSETSIITLDALPEEFKTPAPLLLDLDMTPVPFVLVKPMSRQWTDLIREELRKGGVVIEGEGVMHGFETFARHAYGLDRGPASRFRWLMLARKIDPVDYNTAHVFMLSPSEFEVYNHVLALKYRIRDIIGKITYQVSFMDEPDEMTINHLHIPDRWDLKKEYNVLAQLIASTPVEL